MSVAFNELGMDRPVGSDGHEGNPRVLKAAPSSGASVHTTHQQRAQSERADPEADHGRRHTDHDRRAPGPYCGHGDPDEEDREEEEEHAENATLRRGGHPRDSTGPKDRDYNRSATQGRSSTGRAPVSKTGGCRFESCRPCTAWLKPLETAGDWRALANNWRAAQRRDFSALGIAPVRPQS